MRRVWIALLLGAVVASLTAPTAYAVGAVSLRTTLARLHARLGPSAGAEVIDLRSGTLLYAHRPSLPVTPASNEKLFVTATALLRFGAAETLMTTIRAAPGVEIAPDGTLDGDLYLVGGGDPTLGDRGLRNLVGQLREAGLRRVKGAIVGDESAFDALRGGPDSRYRYDWYLGGGLSALSWAHGRMRAGSPAAAAAIRFGALLKARGIRYERRPRPGTLPTLGGVTASTPLATLRSPAMGTLVAGTNLPSENFYAEMLTKDLGAQFGAGGTTTGGLKVVAAQLATFGIKPRLVDGSGLSRRNLTSASQVAELLLRMDAQDVAPAWRASLPVAGVSGTLRKRMRGTAAARRCRAKTGTLTGVSSLSGYCTTTAGVPVAFSLLENRVCAACAKRIEDRMVSVIARYDG